jgi:isopentenyldiphosphate isomerase
MKNKISSVILVFNEKGELALQLRSATDKSYPLHWDFSAAGGVEPGESSKASAIRELKEELGIETTVEFIGEELYKDKYAQDKLYIYKALHNGPFKPDPAEVDEARFFKLGEIENMLKSGTKFHPEFPFLWNKGIITKINAL